MDQLLGLFYSLTADPAGMQAVTIGGVALVTLLLLWLIGRGLASGAVIARKRQDVAMHAADTLASLYGEVASGGKNAAALCEAFTLQVTAGRTIAKADMAMLQGLRQNVLGTGGVAMDKAKFSEQALHLARVLSGSGPNGLPPLKLAQKQFYDATGTKPAAPAKKAEPAPVAKKPEPAPAKPVAAPAPVAAAQTPAAAAAPAPASAAALVAEKV
jgi:hypothetical protein